jgi:hypothetical protein
MVLNYVTKEVLIVSKFSSIYFNYLIYDEDKNLVLLMSKMTPLDRQLTFEALNLPVKRFFPILPKTELYF